MSGSTNYSDRCKFFVAPPKRRAVHRRAAGVVPLRQVVYLTTTEQLKPALFHEPLLSGSEREGKRKRLRDTDVGEVRAVSVLVWPDTTLRELLEAVIQQFPAACKEWLGSVGTSEADNKTVKVTHAYPGADRLPVLTQLASLHLNGPIDTKNDLITFSSLQDPNGACFKAGDLLAFCMDLATASNAKHEK